MQNTNVVLLAERRLEVTEKNKRKQWLDVAILLQCIGEIQKCKLIFQPPLFSLRFERLLWML